MRVSPASLMRPIFLFSEISTLIEFLKALMYILKTYNAAFSKKTTYPQDSIADLIRYFSKIIHV